VSKRFWSKVEFLESLFELKFQSKLKFTTICDSAASGGAAAAEAARAWTATAVSTLGDLPVVDLKLHFMLKFTFTKH
jgi:hypothetical protein